MVFDGDCPLCRHFSLVYRLRQSGVDLVFVNARDGGELIDYCKAHELNLNEGVVVLHNGKVLHGERAFSYLASLSSSRLHRFVSSLPWSVRALSYGFLKGARRLLLKLIGVSQL